MSIEKTLFGHTEDQKEVFEYSLCRKGVTLGILNYGATVHKLLIPCGDTLRDVVGGYDTVAEYQRNDGYQGAVIGRIGNRIQGGRFTLEDKEYLLFQNDNENSLHGGKRGFDKYLWEATEESGDGFDRLILEMLSPHMDEGYPGNLKVKVSYTLHDDASFSIRYQASTDRKTVVNLTNHSYFNLNGFDGSDVLTHKLRLQCSRYTPVNAALIPTGQIASVEDTPFDFREKKALGRDIEANHEQLRLGAGYDHNLVIDRVKPLLYQDRTLWEFATLWAPDDSLCMRVATDQPGVHLYSANFLHDDLSFKGGIPQTRRSALCLETQHFPNSPNQENFPSVVLCPGQEYDSTTLFCFSY